MAKKGGRIPPDGRQAQAKGVGKNAKRHDLERPATPGLHNSDLQQGDVQALEQGQRIAPRSTQQPALPAPNIGSRPTSGAQMSQAQGVQVPDAIEFLAGKNGAGFGPPQIRRQVDESAAMTWMPILRRMAAGPGASPKLVNAFIEQARKMQQSGGQPATIVDSYEVDDIIDSMTRTEEPEDNVA